MWDAIYKYETWGLTQTFLRLTGRAIQLLHLLGVGALQELVQVVLGRGLVLIAPRYELMMNFLLKFFQIPFTANGIE